MLSESPGLRRRTEADSLTVDRDELPEVFSRLWFRSEGGVIISLFPKRAGGIPCESSVFFTDLLVSPCAHLGIFKSRDTIRDKEPRVVLMACW